MKKNFFFLNFIIKLNWICSTCCKNIYFLDVVFMVKYAVESGVCPALLISSGCSQIWAERYVTSLK